jgi:hypothetical protein
MITAPVATSEAGLDLTGAQQEGVRAAPAEPPRSAAADNQGFSALREVSQAEPKPPLKLPDRFSTDVIFGD